MGRSSQEASLSTQLASYDTEINAVSPLVLKGFYARNKFLALVRDKTRIDGDLGTCRGDIARLKEALEELQVQIKQTSQKFLEDVGQQLADARGKLSDLRERLAVAEDVLTRVDVRAARAGIIQSIKVHAVGAVIRPGDTIAEVVPVGDSLIMAARVSPLDIDSVQAGQKAEVRFPAFSSRQTPTILGSVASISADSMVDETTKEPYYLAQVLIDRATIKPDLLQRLVPGMPADVLIARGGRTVLSYLLDPLTGAIAKSMRER
jgi:HlyD family secretion protein